MLFSASVVLFILPTTLQHIVRNSFRHNFHRQSLLLNQWPAVSPKGLHIIVCTSNSTSAPVLSTSGHKQTPSSIRSISYYARYDKNFEKRKSSPFLFELDDNRRKGTKQESTTSTVSAWSKERTESSKTTGAAKGDNKITSIIWSQLPRIIDSRAMLLKLNNQSPTETYETITAMDQRGEVPIKDGNLLSLFGLLVLISLVGVVGFLCYSMICCKG